MAPFLKRDEENCPLMVEGSWAYDVDTKIEKNKVKKNRSGFVLKTILNLLSAYV